MSNKTEDLLVESAKQSLNKILEKSNISKWIKFSQIPSKIGGSKVAPNYIDSYGCVKFGSSDNPWNMLGINVFVKKGNGDKKDSSNPRRIQFRLIADYAKEAKDKGAKFALMEEICRRSNNKASIASGKKNGVYCLESDAIEVANCIAKIMSEGDKQFFAGYDLNDELNVCINGEDKRVSISVKSRRGQSKFREKLLAKHNSTCLVTGCGVKQILEAAHIYPHGKETNYKDSNGLLLRADIHTLFDLHLITIDKDSRVTIDASLIGSEYQKYDGKLLLDTVTKDMRINLEARLKLISEQNS